MTGSIHYTEALPWLSKLRIYFFNKNIYIKLFNVIENPFCKHLRSKRIQKGTKKTDIVSFDATIEESLIKGIIRVKVRETWP